MAQDTGNHPTPDPGDRRDPSAGRSGDRRRGGWRDFRQAYPGFVFTLFIALIAMLAIDGMLIMKRRAYADEVKRLQSNMSEQERAKTDAIVAAEHNKTRIALELARRQAKIAKTLHLSVAVDSGRIYLEREGAVLREMAAAFGPETKAGPDSIPVVIPRGEMSVAAIDADKVTLEGGTVIAATSAPSLAQDTTPIPPGSVRIPLTDMKAIMPNLKVGMPVYFY
jgi:type III secretory pathway component EscV